jgi:RNA polymerase sigma-70 factor (ECF subfamily)
MEGAARMAISSEERTLISRAVKRDPEAFAQLYVRFYDQVLRRVSTIVRDRYDAEDVTSEAFLRAWNAIPRFEVRDVSILAWFCTIAERLAVKHVKGRRPSIAVDDMLLDLSPEGDPVRCLEREADIATVRSALEQLPMMQREIVSRRFLHDLSYDELGVATGKSVGTIRVIQHRALKALRTIVSANAGRQPAPVKIGQ